MSLETLLGLCIGFSMGLAVSSIRSFIAGICQERETNRIIKHYIDELDTP